MLLQDLPYASSECESCPHCIMIAKQRPYNPLDDTEYRQCKSMKCKSCPSWHQDSYLEPIR